MRSDPPVREAARPLLIAAIVFLALRLPLLSADSVGVYNAHDEGLTNSDARSWVLHGTIFYDTYNPSLLMPLFTLFKAPFFWLLGVNPIGLRLPSTLCLLAAMLLLCDPLRRRGEGLAMKLLLIQLTTSYFWFSHSIVGIREPVLAFAATLAAWWLERAFRSRKTSDYVGAFVSCAAVPLVKTSGVFMPAAFALAIGWKLSLRDGSVPRGGLGAGLGAAAAFWAAVLAWWWGPNWSGVWEFYDLEVVSRANTDALGSFGRLVAMLAVAAPGLLLLSALSGARAVDAAVSDRRRVDDWDLILLSWALCAAPPLIYPVQGYWRWLMWLYPALAGLAAREWSRWCARGWSGEPRLRRAEQRLAVAFAAAVVLTELPYYAKHLKSLDFKLLRLTRETEAVVGDALVSGSNFENMSALSPKLNFVSALMGLRLRSCEDVRRAFPDPERTPAFLAEYAGTASDGEVAARFYAGCPEWKRQFRALGRVSSPQTEGAGDLWFVRAARGAP